MQDCLIDKIPVQISRIEYFTSEEDYYTLYQHFEIQKKMKSGLYQNVCKCLLMTISTIALKSSEPEFSELWELVEILSAYK
jgi:hypothetical protein